MADDGHMKLSGLPKFSGKQDDFTMWWIQFQAYASFNEFDEAIQERAEADLPDTAATATTEVAELAARKRNKRAMACMTMCMAKQSTIGLLQSAMSTEYPNGRACEVVRLLFKKFRPVDTITRVEMRVKLNQIKMSAGEDPSTLFEQINTVKNEYNSSGKKIDEEDLIAVVLVAAPKDYQSLLTSIVIAKEANLELVHLEDAMNKLWRSDMQENSEEDATEVALGAFDRGGGKGRGFSGTCYNCNKAGHMAMHCPEKGAGQETQKTRKQ